MEFCGIDWNGMGQYISADKKHCFGSTVLFVILVHLFDFQFEKHKAEISDVQCSMYAFGQ